MTEGPLEPRRERALIFLLAAIQFTHITDFVVMMPLGPQFMRVFQLEAQEFSVLVSAYSVSAAVFSLIAAFFLDRWDRKRSLVWVYLGFVVGTLTCGISHSYAQLLAGRIIAGAFGGTVSAISFAIIGDVIPAHRRGRAMGALMASFSVASVVGLPAGLFMASHFGWESVFLGIALMGCGLCLYAYSRVPSLRFHLAAARSKTLWQEFDEILRRRACQRGLLFAASVTATGFLIIPFISPSFVANAGVAESQLSLIYLVGGFCTFFTSQWVGRLSDRWGYRQVFQALALSSLVPIALITNLGYVGIVWATAVSSLFMVLVSGRMVPSMALLTSLVRPDQRGAFMSLVTFCQQIAMGLGSLVAGRLVTVNNGKLLHYNRSGFAAMALTFFALWLVRSFHSPAELAEGVSELHVA